jgi:hypothetical protein
VALEKAGIAEYVRQFHDLRHSSVTKAAGDAACCAHGDAGRSNFKATQGYIDLAGEMFREAERLERGLCGKSSA